MARVVAETTRIGPMRTRRTGICGGESRTVGGNGIWGLGDSSECKNLRDWDDEGSSEDVDVVQMKRVRLRCFEVKRKRHVCAVCGLTSPATQPQAAPCRTPLASWVTWLLYLCEWRRRWAQWPLRPQQPWPAHPHLPASKCVRVRLGFSGPLSVLAVRRQVEVVMGVATCTQLVNIIM